MSFTVSQSAAARDDLRRLHEHLLEQELRRDGDLDLADQAVQAVLDGFAMLKKFPFACRKAVDSTFLRELVIPFGHTGYVALFEIMSADSVIVVAVRHQREDDYH